MTADDVRVRLARIRENAARDPEAAHGEEDDLYKDVLRAIAEGVWNPKKLAALALEAADIEFPRWCA